MTRDEEVLQTLEEKTSVILGKAQQSRQNRGQPRSQRFSDIR